MHLGKGRRSGQKGVLFPQQGASKKAEDNGSCPGESLESPPDGTKVERAQKLMP